MLSPLAAYGQFLYLDRGYAFFAPDPGPSHLMRVEMSRPATGDEGEQSPGLAEPNTETRLYPDLNDQWPRLRYHRHFMLAEFLHDSYQPKLPAEAASLVGSDLAIEELQAWRLGRKRYEMIRDSMSNHLQSKFGDREIKIDRLEHLIPDFVAYAQSPTPLNDPPTYILLEDIPISLDTLLGALPQSLPEPEPNPEPVPKPRETVPAPSGIPIPEDRPRRTVPDGANSPTTNPTREPDVSAFDRPVSAGDVSQ
ncbi:hypothetical protein [Aporhodopirellula aestuarii]|nr:hypothetical protein [Aporhodopirellula aestuarii]